MKKIFYEKIGRKYVPVAEYDSDYLDSFPKGNHLVMCYPGGASRVYNIDPAYAPMIAAGRIATDVISDALVKATEFRVHRQGQQPLTLEQKAAWDKLVEVFGDRARQLERPSAREIAQAGIAAMEDEAMKLMQNPAVKKAYDNFILICKLVNENENTLSI